MIPSVSINNMNLNIGRKIELPQHLFLIMLMFSSLLNHIDKPQATFNIVIYLTLTLTVMINTSVLLQCCIGSQTTHTMIVSLAKSCSTLLQNHYTIVIHYNIISKCHHIWCALYVSIVSFTYLKLYCIVLKKWPTAELSSLFIRLHNKTS